MEVSAEKERPRIEDELDDQNRDAAEQQRSKRAEYQPTETSQAARAGAAAVDRRRSQGHVFHASNFPPNSGPRRAQSYNRSGCRAREKSCSRCWITAWIRRSVDSCISRRARPA